ncbi:DEAD-domain-containing protein-like protein [Dinothrombium tinctorium]|uniref:ATP-dependent RNA helicase n=1 Tax=Dinothrombium tinctorium TaxID=1965070 RepID=A0A443QLD0_9ACAR|nr:DEAD-domain-containing protein-like protein [Dinothrombium tinctorium]
MSRKNETNWRDLNLTFVDLDLKRELFQALDSSETLEPTILLYRTIKAVKNCFNLCLESKFTPDESLILAIAILERIELSTNSNCQAIVVCSDATSVKNVVDAFVSNFSQLKVKFHVCTHQTSIVDDISALKAGVQIVIGTAGRIYDLIGIGLIWLEAIKVLALILSEDNNDSCDDIIDLVPENVQRIMFVENVYVENFKRRFNSPISVRKEILTTTIERIECCEESDDNEFDGINILSVSSKFRVVTKAEAVEEHLKEALRNKAQSLSVLKVFEDETQQVVEINSSKSDVSKDSSETRIVDALVPMESRESDKEALDRAESLNTELVKDNHIDYKGNGALTSLELDDISNRMQLNIEAVSLAEKSVERTTPDSEVSSKSSEVSDTKQDTLNFLDLSPNSNDDNDAVTEEVSCQKRQIEQSKCNISFAVVEFKPQTNVTRKLSSVSSSISNENSVSEQSLAHQSKAVDHFKNSVSSDESGNDRNSFIDVTSSSTSLDEFDKTFLSVKSTCSRSEDGELLSKSEYQSLTNGMQQVIADDDKASILSSKNSEISILETVSPIESVKSSPKNESPIQFPLETTSNQFVDDHDESTKSIPVFSPIVTTTKEVKSSGTKLDLQQLNENISKHSSAASDLPQLSNMNQSDSDCNEIIDSPDSDLSVQEPKLKGIDKYESLVNEISTSKVISTEENFLVSKQINCGVEMAFQQENLKLNLENTFNLKASKQTACEFKDFIDKRDLLKGIRGFERPTSLQKRAIVSILKQKDVIIESDRGCKMTTAIAIALLRQVDILISDCQILVLVSEVQVANKIQEAILSIGRYMKVYCHVCTGGSRVNEDIRILGLGQHIVVGVPSCIYAMILRNALRTNSIITIVLYELGELLNACFKDQMLDIFNAIQTRYQILALTRNTTVAVSGLVKKLMKNPVKIYGIANFETIGQYYVKIDKQDAKFDAFWFFYKKLNVKKTIVYCNTIDAVEKLKTQLKNRNIKLLTHHLTSIKTNEYLKDLEKEAIYVTTDAEVYDLKTTKFSLLINYDFPTSEKKYFDR